MKAVVLSVHSWNHLKVLLVSENRAVEAEVKLHLPREFLQLASEELLTGYVRKLVGPDNGLCTVLKLKQVRGTQHVEAWLSFPDGKVSLARALAYAMILDAASVTIQNSEEGGELITLRGETVSFDALKGRRLLSASAVGAKSSRWIQKATSAPGFRAGATRRRAQRMGLLHGKRDTLSNADLNKLAAAAKKTPSKRDDRQVQFAKNVRRK